MADAAFENERLAELYDPLDPDRSDLIAYTELVTELGARAVLDIGCGTGTFACLLALRGITVIGLDPALASLQVARRKEGADLVQWLHGDAATLPPLTVDLVTMTANVAQVFVTDEAWAATLAAATAALRPGGFLVFESRDPAKQGWLDWNKANSHQLTETPGVGPVEAWHELVDVTGELVTFRAVFVFHADGTTLTSESTLRFRSLPALVDSVTDAGLAVREIRDAPDRPGREFVVIAQH